MSVVNAPTFKFTVSVLETRVVATVGSGREVMRAAGANTTLPAHTFEARFTQETGTH